MRLNQSKKRPAVRGTCLARLKQQRRQGRTEREGVEGGKNDRNGNGDGELLVQAAGDAGDEDGGDEDGGQDQRDGDDGSGYLVHRLESGVARRHAFFNVTLDGFDDDDGVVDDEADGEHEPEQRESIDGEAEQRKDRRRCR